MANAATTARQITTQERMQRFSKRLRDQELSPHSMGRCTDPWKPPKPATIHRDRYGVPTSHRHLTRHGDTPA
jgi:hypothetical protein